MPASSKGKFRADIFVVLLMWAVFSSGFIAVSHYRVNSFLEHPDLAHKNNIVFNLAHGDLGVSTTLPWTNSRIGPFHHFNLLLFLLTPIYYFLLPILGHGASGVDILVSLRALIIASGIIPVFYYFREKDGGLVLPVIMAAAYICNLFVLTIGIVGFRPLALGLPGIMALMYFDKIRQRKGMILSLIYIILCREEYIVFSFVFGLCLLIRKRYRAGWETLFISVAFGLAYLALFPDPLHYTGDDNFSLSPVNFWSTATQAAFFMTWPMILAALFQWIILLPGAVPFFFFNYYCSLQNPQVAYYMTIVVALIIWASCRTVGRVAARFPKLKLLLPVVLLIFIIANVGMKRNYLLAMLTTPNTAEDILRARETLNPLIADQELTILSSPIFIPVLSSRSRIYNFNRMENYTETQLSAVDYIVSSSPHYLSRKIWGGKFHLLGETDSRKIIQLDFIKPFRLPAAITWLENDPENGGRATENRRGPNPPSM